MNKQACKRNFAYCILFVMIVAGLTIILYPFFQELTETNYQAKIQNWISNMGIAGVIFIFAIQVIQIVIAFISGEPVELIAGIIGILGIGFKDRLITFCRVLVNRQHKRKTRCESLDFVKITHKDKVYPMMYCHMELTGHIDIEQLKNAVALSSHYVPEILYSFNFKSDNFTDKGFTSDDVFSTGEWDLSKKPQLQISIKKQSGQNTVIVGMSHILSDGEGFLQYLYLLALLYNGMWPNNEMVNNRSVASILKSVKIQSPTEQTKYNKKTIMRPLRPASNGTQQFCLCSNIYSNDLDAIHDKVKRYGSTLNDVFIAAYARVIARLQNIDTVIIPCPADLRRFKSETDSLTIANMTGSYQRITVEISPKQAFAETVKQVNLETVLQKSRCRCFAGIKILDMLFHKIPRTILRQAIKFNYRLQPISYTNLGVIDHERLFFKDCNLTECYITGAYRLPPDFQLSISTFRNKCTLNCTLLGTDEDKRISQAILEQVKSELLMWNENN